MEEKEVKLIEMEKVLSELCLSHKDIIYIDKNETAERIRKIPSIDIEPKRGEWIDISEWYAPRQKCSICETIVVGYGSNFCPNCGARMIRKTNTTAEEKPTPIRDYMVHGKREGE